MRVQLTNRSPFIEDDLREQQQTRRRRRRERKGERAALLPSTSRGRGRRSTPLPGGERNARADGSALRAEERPPRFSQRDDELRRGDDAAVAAVAAAARRPGWSTTRDCAVITAACGRKHVGTRGRGASPRPLYVSSECARARADAPALRRCVRARRVPWESARPCAERERERERGRDKERLYKSDRSLPRLRRVPINPFLSVFPPTRPRPGDAPLQRCIADRPRPPFFDSIDRGDLRGSSGSFPRDFNCRADSAERRDAVCIVVNASIEQRSVLIMEI